MHPFLFDWVVQGHHLKVPSYGVLLAIAFSAAYFESLRRAVKLGEDPKHIENLFLCIVFGAVIGSRGFHVLFEEPEYYSQHPMKIFAIWEGGYTFYGAVLVAMLAVFLYCRRRKVRFLQFIDIAAASTILGLSIGRIGCFLAGCCWGRPTTMPWGVRFTNLDTFANVKDVPLHPTQIYESLGAAVLFIYLLWRFSRRKYEGQIFFHALIGYSVLRFVVEIYRGDDYRGFLFGGLISYSQFLAMILLPFALAGIGVYSRQKTGKGP